ncbi:hypothetical protein JWG44_08855 [Leptospira sp. 201903071]|uniref:hypothetical protein n=1 Tax=Leptospira ainazelensis TaxID=2810034 RepID=UPI00196254F9|nr:hypothetical protein [Leptospira ainazelensis]MBM9500355.1 hypothetical protein [Leptospira ainazelensis]
MLSLLGVSLELYYLFALFSLFMSVFTIGLYPLLPVISILEALAEEFGIIDLSLSQAAGIYAILTVAPIFNATLPIVIVVSGYLGRIYFRKNPNDRIRMWISVFLYSGFLFFIYFSLYLFLRHLAIEKII